MPAVASYSEAGLAAFMATELSATGTALFGDAPATAPELVQAVTAVERLLGVTDVAMATDMALVEAAARWEAWKAARNAAAGQFDLKAGSADLKQSQVFEHIAAMLASTESAYYTALATSQAASGSTPFFAFGLACGGRGR